MKRRIVLLVTGVMLAAAVWLLIEYWPSHNGPVYEGKSARDWLREATGPNSKQAMEAFHQMGPAAVPFLVRALEKKDSVWDRFYQTNYPKLPLAVRNYLPPPLPDLPRWNGAAMAITKVDAKSAVPDFARLLAKGKGRQQFFALVVLVHFIEPADANCVPILVEKLQSPEPGVCTLAIVALDRIGPRAKAAGPALAKLLDSPDPQLRGQATLTLKRIDPETAAKQKTN